MRVPVLSALAVVAACSRPNPAFLTDSGGSSGGEASDGSAAATGTTGTATTSGSSTGADTTAVAETTAGTTAPTSSDATTGAMECVFPDGPGIELTYSTDAPTGCNTNTPRQVHVEVLGQAGVNQWKFNVCGDPSVCRDPEQPCDNGEHVIVTFDGPAELAPTFAVGDCHALLLLARGEDPGDVNACRLKLLRIAHTKYTPDAVHYVGAISVPGTQGLPGMLDWFGLLGFDVVATLAEKCPDALNCQPPVGRYDLKVNWGEPAVVYQFGEGGGFTEQIVVKDANDSEVAIAGEFTAVRARIEPGVCGTGQQFDWVWRATIPAQP